MTCSVCSGKGTQTLKDPRYEPVYDPHSGYYGHEYRIPGGQWTCKEEKVPVKTVICFNCGGTGQIGEIQVK